MSYSIEITSLFAKQLKRLAKKYPSLKTEFAELVAELKENPFIGKALGNDCYKIRIAIASKGRGKSGGARVITHLQVTEARIFLLSIYDKAEQSDIRDSDLTEWLGSI